MTELVIDGTQLFYKVEGRRYIITYITDYNTDIDTYLHDIFQQLLNFYRVGSLFHSNRCGENATLACNKLRLEPNETTAFRIGRIFIVDWDTLNLYSDPRFKVIAPIYGNGGGTTIGATYHSLLYIEIMIEGQTTYIAVETASCHIYTLQYYVGNTPEELEEILKARYLCKGYRITYECDKPCYEVAYGRGLGLGVKRRTNRLNKLNKKRRKTVRRKTVRGKTVRGKTVRRKTVRGKTVRGKTVRRKTVRGKRRNH